MPLLSIIYRIPWMWVILILIALIADTHNKWRKLFTYPYFVRRFDVSGKRQPNMEDYIDQYLIEHHMREIDGHIPQIQSWKRHCADAISKSWIKTHRELQFQQAIDDEQAFQFILCRNKTKYVQKNYIKTAYQDSLDVETFSCSYEWLLDRYQQLQDIDFACPLSEYHSKNQRKLMTRPLREEIMRRDRYTCQICGKYMPDEVGLQIDHIIPVSKGGKTIPSNLQVLCDKCNRKKSAKL